MNTHYDGIILGAGHNSLVLQAYLCRAGLDVVCLERSETVGGGLRTEDHNGFLHNTHSFYHRALTSAPWYTDLELERRGAHYIEPELNVVLLTRDGRALEWWADFEKTVASFAHFSRRDAERLRYWRDAFRPIVEKILIPEAQSPPLPPQERTKKLSASPEGRLLLETSQLSPQQFALREFEHPLIQAGLLFFNGLREVDLRAPGFGHHIPALLASKGKAQMCVGGSAQLARALLSAVEEEGGRVLTNTAPKRIIIEGDRAVGVETEHGDVLHARHFVASGLNPQQTFLDLMDEEVLPAAWRRKVKAFRYNVLAPLFGVYANLGERPIYTAEKDYPHVNKGLMMIMGLDGAARFDEIVRSHEEGLVPPTVMWGSCPTLFDATQAPSGQHAAFMWEKLPYKLRGDAQNWDAEAQGHGHRMLEVWSEHAPNIRDAVLETFVRSPLDVERTLPNMRYGDLLVGSLGHGQVGYNRPFAGAGHYRAHLRNLYLCGSCCHPSGNITGFPGYNCAQVLVADLDLEPIIAS
ncbi:MAG: phytoene dehydrogenase-like protein [Candidatus Latescibacterota bacterium]|jgi:phytoene dehydrogenase-like protein